MTHSWKRAPINPQGLLLLSCAYRQLGNSGLAAAMARKAGVQANDQDQANVLENKLPDHPADIALHQQLAAIYDRLNELDKATIQRLAIRQLRIGESAIPPERRQFQASVDAVLSTH